MTEDTPRWFSTELIADFKRAHDSGNSSLLLPGFRWAARFLGAPQITDSEADERLDLALQGALIWYTSRNLAIGEKSIFPQNDNIKDLIAKRLGAVPDNAGNALAAHILEEAITAFRGQAETAPFIYGPVQLILDNNQLMILRRQNHYDPTS